MTGKLHYSNQHLWTLPKKMADPWQVKSNLPGKPVRPKLWDIQGAFTVEVSKRVTELKPAARETNAQPFPHPPDR